MLRSRCRALSIGKAQGRSPLRTPATRRTPKFISRRCATRFATRSSGAMSSRLRTMRRTWSHCATRPQERGCVSDADERDAPTKRGARCRARTFLSSLSRSSRAMAKQSSSRVPPLFTHHLNRASFFCAGYLGTQRLDSCTSGQPDRQEFVSTSRTRRATRRTTMKRLHMARGYTLGDLRQLSRTLRRTNARTEGMRRCR